MNVPFDAEAPDKNTRHRTGNTTTSNAMKQGSRRKPPQKANGICEAVSRPAMRFVPIKSVEQQAVLCLHRNG